MAAASSSTRLGRHVLEARERLAESREAIRSQHEVGLPPLQVCARLTSAVDAAILSLFEAALADLPGDQADQLRGTVSLIPHGGYGRRQMAPCSDVDLMLLYEPSARAGAEELARRLTQDIFDAGLQLGHSLRTAGEAVALARSDAVIATSLVESRYLAGDTALFDGFAEQFRRAVQRRPKAFCDEFIEARRQERQKYGETVYLLEPNVKRSRGGLRDVHLLRWLWYAHTGLSDLDLLRTKGVLSKFDHHRLTTSRDFLLKVRTEMHYHAGAARDALTRGEQVRIAEKFGYPGADGLLPVEQFMQDYFRHAGQVWFLTARVVELSSPRPAVATALGSVFGRSIQRDYRLDDREISATTVGRAKLASRVDEALRLVDLARLTGRRINQDTWYLVYRSAPRYSAEITDASRERFLELMDNPLQLGKLLRRLHELGVLEKVIPEFARARCLLQFNQYHQFTVDEHCIRAVDQATRFAESEDAVGVAYRSLRSKRQLHLALLLHDLGKGHEEDHSVLGTKIVDHNARRLGLPDDENEQLQWLVLKHLTMSHRAFRRDLRDPQMLAEFASEVGSKENLRLLFLLTCADLAAVGPGVLNAWKVEMLTELYRNTLEVLSPQKRLEVGDRRSAMRTAIWKLLSAEDRENRKLRRYFAALPESMTTSRPPAAVAGVLRRLRDLPESGVDAWGEPHTGGTSELIAAVRDGVGRGVFSRMAGALSSARLQILAAETAVMHDGTLVLRYIVEGPSEPLAGEPGARTLEGRIEELCQRMVASVDSETPPAFPRVWGAEQVARQAALTNLPSEVRIDTSLSDEWVIVEVFTVDRRGLLYELASAVHEMGLVIRFAKIATSADQVIDVFYVSERDESKPAGEERLAEVKAKLMGVIDPSLAEESL
ncbi:MAG: [protein-PII] uridylyltransferase [Planctomycetota bacterium]